MAEVLVAFTTELLGRNGRRYEPRACGALTDDGLYEGWIEFVPIDDRTPVRTPRETLQPNRADLVYWATGLTQAYLEGALSRALSGPIVIEQERSLPPVFDRPAPSRVIEGTGSVMPRALLNPYEVYQQGESVLIAELGALSTGHLRDIVLAYGFTSPEAAERASAGELTRLIIDGVRSPRATTDAVRVEP